MTVSKDQITICIPTFNEEESIAMVIQEAGQEGYRNILVVDGYSKDETINIAEKNGADVIKQHGKGKGDAVKTAIENVKTPYMLVMDGNGTYSPLDIKGFLPHIESYDEIIGIRKSGRENISLVKKFGIKLITIFFNVLFGKNLPELPSGMYMLRTEFAKKLDFRSKSYDIDMEIAAQTAIKGRLTEVPVSYRNRISNNGQNFSMLNDGPHMLLALIDVKRRFRQPSERLTRTHLFVGWSILIAFTTGVTLYFTITSYLPFIQGILLSIMSIILLILFTLTK